MPSFLERFRTRFSGKPGEAQKQLVAAYRTAFDGEAGSIVLHDLVVQCHVMTTHGGGAFEEGQRSTVLYILKMLRTDPERLQRLADREVTEDE